jgi:hypothetical protein
MNSRRNITPNRSGLPGRSPSCTPHAPREVCITLASRNVTRSVTSTLGPARGTGSASVFGRAVIANTGKASTTHTFKSRPAGGTYCAILAALLLGGLAMPTKVYSRDTAGTEATTCNFPTLRAEHKYARSLLENAMRYVAAESQTVDAASGYPVEGWNHEPGRGLCLRSFTQITAIGEWIEVHADVATGLADTPFLSREHALDRLTQVIASLRRDQKDPALSSHGLLGNFLGLSAEGRLGPLCGDVDKSSFITAFGPKRGEAVWQALLAKGWLVTQANGREANVLRGAGYGDACFDGPLAPYRERADRKKIMAILDQRVVAIVFGDNANLTTSIGKAVGALLAPSVKNQPKVAAVRREMEQFLEDQREGYTALYDAKAGMFSFGWDARRNRPLGWWDAQGRWQTGYMDYMVNEFRGPATFVVVRFGLPTSALKNLGFKIKSSTTDGGDATYALAPWDGSAFQALGLGLSMMELDYPGWRRMLQNVVDIELDYSARKRLPGFLSESYTGDGLQYSGSVGIPDIAVNAAPRITNAASLYTLGVAYMVAPAKIEQFLSTNWPAISKLLTDHGPWEGFNIAKNEPIQIQTTAHTLSLVLGLLGTGSANMQRYLEFKGLGPSLSAIYKPGAKVDLLADDKRVFAWSNGGCTLTTERKNHEFHVTSSGACQIGIAFVTPQPHGENLSSALVTLRYRCRGTAGEAVLCFKASEGPPGPGPCIPNELFTRFRDTGEREEEIQVLLPATPGLSEIKEVVITYGHQQNRPVDLTITRLSFAPYDETVKVQAARQRDARGAERKVVLAIPAGGSPTVRR